GLALLIAGFGFTHPGQATKPAEGTERAAQPAGGETPGKLTLRAVAATTNQPLEGVSIEYQGRFDGKDREGTVATGKDGLATIDYPPGTHVGFFYITARKAGLVPVCIWWDDARHPVAMPPSKDLRFEPGTTIGGIVRDESGRPIAGARVEV